MSVLHAWLVSPSGGARNCRLIQFVVSARLQNMHICDASVRLHCEADDCHALVAKSLCKRWIESASTLMRPPNRHRGRNGWWLRGLGRCRWRRRCDGRRHLRDSRRCGLRLQVDIRRRHEGRRRLLQFWRGRWRRFWHVRWLFLHHLGLDLLKALLDQLGGKACCQCINRHHMDEGDDTDADRAPLCRLHGARLEGS